jgi:ABC-2 type transport system ATP-binding protein
MEFLARTEISPRHRVRELSKGMVTQLHLALVMAVDARLLVLDEPTIGLDILYRRAFYEQLLNDYFDEERTIIVTTHQVEEIERILTDAVFIDRGRIVLDMPMDQLPERFIELSARADAVQAARDLGPLSERQALGRHVFLFDTVPPERVAALGDTRVPALTDLFVATVQGGRP